MAEKDGIEITPPVPNLNLINKSKKDSKKDISSKGRETFTRLNVEDEGVEFEVNNFEDENYFPDELMETD